jgi:hypothetical protein
LAISNQKIRKKIWSRAHGGELKNADSATTSPRLV